MSNLWAIVWVVLMMFWLFFGGYTIYNSTDRSPQIVAGSFIPWACVAIPGWVVLGSYFRQSPPK